MDTKTPNNSISTIKQQQTAPDCIRIGERVRELRKKTGLSIRALANICHLSTNTVSLIENNHTSPSVQTLFFLAKGLGVPMTSIFSCAEPEQVVVYQKQGQRLITKFSTGEIENLGDGLPPLGAEPILVTLENRQHVPENISHEGREFVYCLDGRMSCVIVGQPYVLSRGDSLLFDASLPHHWENADLLPSRLLVLFCPMDAHDQPAERHLEH